MVTARSPTLGSKSSSRRELTYAAPVQEKYFRDANGTLVAGVMPGVLPSHAKLLSDRAPDRNQRGYGNADGSPSNNGPWLW